MTTLVVCGECRLACYMRREGDTTEWVCPCCDAIVVWHWDGGEVDLEAIRSGEIAKDGFGSEFILLHD